ncbi:MAG: M43 family zinc metalloprotease, partial [Bacteroidota bacterium]
MNMWWKYIPLFFTVLFTDTSEHQHCSNTEKHFCAQHELMEKLIQQDPEFRRRHEEVERQMYIDLLSNRTNGGGRMDYVLPVVVHIVHDGGAENISDADVLLGIDNLNEAFANTGYYDPSTGVDTRIQFCMASRDPQGNSTNGITRTQSSLTNMTDYTSQDLSVKNLSRWNPLEYINIWLVREICRPGACGVAGYAYFPSAHGSSVDGIMMEARWFAQSKGSSGVQIHEMGHYLGLYHTFQGGCTNNDCLLDGDRVCDTPPDQSTARVPCGGSANSCTSDVNTGDPNNPFTTDQQDMYINYMDYGDFDCYSAFSQGQSDRMHFTIENIRQSLLDSKACQTPCTSPITAAFTPGGGTIDLGTSLNFNNNSSNATRYQWQVNGTDFSSATNPSYTFNTEGVFTITLWAYNGDPNCQDSINVLFNVVCPVIADFNSSTISVPQGDQLTFTNNSSAATSYEWYVDGVLVSQQTDLTYTFLTPGINEICLKAIGQNCEKEFCRLVAVTVDSDDCQSTFVKTFGQQDLREKANCLALAEDGNLYIGGDQGGLLVIAKVSTEGNLIWQKALDISSHPEVVADIQRDSDNNLLICGYGDGPINNSSSVRIGFILKFDPINQQVLWLRREATNNRTTFTRIQEIQAGGNYLVVGGHFSRISGLSALDCNAQMAVLDRNNGNTISLNNSYDMGSCETFRDMHIRNNKIYLVGRYNFAGGGFAQMRGSFSVFDLNGNHEMTRLHLMPVADQAYMHATSIIPQGDDFVILYNGDHDSDNRDLWLQLSQTRADGTIIWAKQYQSPVSSDLLASGLLAVPGGYLIYSADRQNRKAVLIKTDRLGEVEWAKRYGGGSQFEVALISENIQVGGNFIYMLGAMAAPGSTTDIGLLKTDLNGNFEGACDFVEDIEIRTIPYNDPYDDLHDIDLVPSPVVTQDISIVDPDIVLETEDLCEIVCLEICDNG